MTAHNDNRPSQTNNRIIGKLLLLVVMMFGFGFALVPLYDVFCDVTGLNGKTGGKVNFSTPPVVDKSRLVKVTFLASLNESMPWEFEPQQTSVEVHPGQPTTITYIARNNARFAITGQAVPSVAPGLAAAYFQKTECFCFTEQELKPGEEKIMPVTFIIDSQLPPQMGEITLSYTFFSSIKDEQAPGSSLTQNQDHKL